MYAQARTSAQRRAEDAKQTFMSEKNLEKITTESTIIIRISSSQSLGTTEESNSTTASEKDDSIGQRYDVGITTRGAQECSSSDEEFEGCSDDAWGFFDEDPEQTEFDLFETIAAEKEREQWTSYTSSLFEKSSLTRSVVEGEIEELYSYTNPAPSQCFKLSSEDIAMAMEMSCSIAGFRIGQRKDTGEILAQYRFIYSYGSRSHISWRSYDEFRELASVLSFGKDHVCPIEGSNSRRLFTRSLKVWTYMDYKVNTFTNDFSIRKLVENSVYLNKFVESVLFESPNPALLLYFAQTTCFKAVE